MKRRIVVSEFKKSYTPDVEPAEVWHEECTVVGNEAVVAGFLRALADDIDPPKKSYSD